MLRNSLLLISITFFGCSTVKKSPLNSDDRFGFNASDGSSAINSDNSSIFLRNRAKEIMSDIDIQQYDSSKIDFAKFIQILKLNLKNNENKDVEILVASDEDNKLGIINDNLKQYLISQNGLVDRVEYLCKYGEISKMFCNSNDEIIKNIPLWDIFVFNLELYDISAFFYSESDGKLVIKIYAQPGTGHLNARNVW